MGVLISQPNYALSYQIVLAAPRLTVAHQAAAVDRRDWANSSVLEVAGVAAASLSI